MTIDTFSIGRYPTTFAGYGTLPKPLAGNNPRTKAGDETGGLTSMYLGTMPRHIATDCPSKTVKTTAYPTKLNWNTPLVPDRNPSANNMPK